MTPEPVIRVENISKRYRVARGRRGRASYLTLRETIAEAVASVHRLRPGGDRGLSAFEEFWALSGVSFEIQAGEVVGIIGGNGAGKSTLLKILSRITRPTAGFAEIRGRVGSLLEVGTGFHPELTGRENIFLNGAILGMTRREITRQFDAIVDFSGVEQFLDTPVKRYSSGMHVRLAFAVAAHLNPEILLIDEVLAVGDAQFQKKCLGKMDEVARGGRTVLFVSHNMAAVQNLCRRVIILKQGQIVDDGEPEACITSYLRGDAPSRATIDLRHSPLRGSGFTPILTELKICDAEDRPTLCVKAGDPLRLHIHYEASRPLINPSFRVNVSTIAGVRLFTVNTRWNLGPLDEAPPRGSVVCTIPHLPLIPGEHLISIGCSEGAHGLDRLDAVGRITVEAHDYFGTGQQPRSKHGLFLVDAAWEVSPMESCHRTAMALQQD